MFFQALPIFVIGHAKLKDVCVQGPGLQHTK